VERLKKKRLRRRYPRWPRLVCSSCGALWWKAAIRAPFRCRRKRCRGIWSRNKDLTTGLILARMKPEQRVVFARLQTIGEKV
jgi:hypothetical protein